MKVRRAFQKTKENKQPEQQKIAIFAFTLAHRVNCFGILSKSASKDAQGRSQLLPIENCLSSTQKWIAGNSDIEKRASQQERSSKKVGMQKNVIVLRSTCREMRVNKINMSFVNILEDGVGVHKRFYVKSAVLMSNVWKEAVFG